MNLRVLFFLVFAVGAALFQYFVTAEEYVDKMEEDCTNMEDFILLSDVDCSFQELSVLPTLDGSLHVKRDPHNDEVIIEENYPSCLSVPLKNCLPRNEKDALFFFEMKNIFDLSHNKITRLPIIRFNLLKELYLHHNPIDRIDEGSLNNLPNLKTLDISNCNISHIGDNQFVYLYKLDKLLLNDNFLKVIEPAQSFFGISKCEIDITRNPLVDDHKNCALLKYVKEQKGFVKYDKNGILFNRDDNFCTPEIVISVEEANKKIRCKANSKIEDDGIVINWRIVNLLEELEIIHSSIYSFSIEIDKSARTSTLQLTSRDACDSCRIQCEFQDQFGIARSQVAFTDYHSDVLSLGKVWAIYHGGPDVVRARCRKCYLQGVPEISKEINSFPLTSIDISQNNIGPLTDDILKIKTKTILTSVKELNLRSCNIPSIANYAFREMESLEILDLGGNNLTTIPTGSFHMLPKLKTLLLGSNPIEQISSQSVNFTNLRKLEVLNLSSCGIERINNDIFLPLSNSIQKLLLDNNNLNKLTFDGWKSIEWSRLTFLNISRNPNISEIPPFTFGRMENLKQLDLSHCALSTIDLNIFCDHRTVNASENNDNNDSNSNEFVECSNQKGNRVSTSLKNLTELKLNDNQLKNVSRDFITAFPYAMIIDLQNNEFSCDCNNYDLYKMIASNRSNIIVSIQNSFDQCINFALKLICVPRINNKFDNSECYVETEKTVLNWFWNNIILPDSSSSFITSNAFNSIEFNSDGENKIWSRFNFTQVGISCGNCEIECVAENSAGKDSKSQHLKGDPNVPLGVHMEPLRVDD